MNGIDLFDDVQSSYSSIHLVLPVRDMDFTTVVAGSVTILQSIIVDLTDHTAAL